MRTRRFIETPLIRWAASCVVGALALGCGDDGGGGPTPVDPDEAPREPIDRFSDEAATFFERSVRDDLPDPNEPIDFDRPPFLVRGFGPDGGAVQYYDFDAMPREPAPIYVMFRDGAANPVAEQLAVVDVVPGDAGYNDLWQVHRVTVPEDFVPNTVTSLDEIQSAGYAIDATDTVVNCPIVPQGSTASLRVDGTGTAPVEGWYRGRIVNYFEFDEAPLETTSTGDVPLSQIYVMFEADPNPEDPASGPASGVLTEPGTNQTHNVLATLPGDGGYSPLWSVNVLDNDDFAQVMDLDSAVSARLLETAVADVNCPVVDLPAL